MRCNVKVIVKRVLEAKILNQQISVQQKKRKLEVTIFQIKGERQ